MEETRGDSGPAEQGPSNTSWWPSDFMEKFESVSLGSQEETLSNKESPRTSEEGGLSPQRASQILWRTGMLSEPIPNGFYSVIPVSLKSDFAGVENHSFFVAIISSRYISFAWLLLEPLSSEGFIIDITIREWIFPFSFFCFCICFSFKW